MFEIQPYINHTECIKFRITSLTASLIQSKQSKRTTPDLKVESFIKQTIKDEYQTHTIYKTPNLICITAKLMEIKVSPDVYFIEFVNNFHKSN
ncbi:conserved hypothetical protein [Vibrio chagasii]|nr:conserved hypothetical protein [Vibrio chagasii]CAH6883036.1 conserved hypothetical protein [Vibrio chagasii]CAH6914125.1 conserved hypothetical protein [Vibrio chagasii]CAH7011859.1 conserved hypothetical protein [Vibrio chagasii]CAH7083914.1 conserved hypothetical protein [Vibrio chagasii]